MATFRAELRDWLRAVLTSIRDVTVRRLNRWIEAL